MGVTEDVIDIKLNEIICKAKFGAFCHSVLFVDGLGAFKWTSGNIHFLVHNFRPTDAY
jgi:hypothetical protein